MRFPAFRWLLWTVVMVETCSCAAPGSEGRRPAGPDVAEAREPAPAVVAAGEEPRVWLLQQVDDVGVAQLYADGFANLTLREKTLAWHLYRAALAGREIYLQQRCEDGLVIRDLVEEILTHARHVDPVELERVRRYAVLLWVNNSPYSAITQRKNVLEGSPEELARAAEAAARDGAQLPLRAGESPRALVARLAPMLFDPAHRPMVTAKSPEGGLDVLQASAVTFYGDEVTVADLEGFEGTYELNSNVVETADGRLVELPWRAGLPEEGIPPGLYAQELEAVIARLEDALPFAPPPTRVALEKLIRFYRTGAREDREAYDVAWVADDASTVDTINGFVEVYMDPLGKKGSWEALVFYEDPVKAALIQDIAARAQWFEDHMPYDDAFKKPAVKGISARSIDVVIETGDSGPVTPIGINLPNDSSIRERHGSKSVSLANVVEAYAQSTPASAREEFCWDADEVAREERWGRLTSELITNMHEVIGHASGRQAPGAEGDPATWIKEYYSALEEARADLVALWFLMDPVMVELGLLPEVEEPARAAYERYTRNGAMLQLRRIKEGDRIEQDHMRNRHMVVSWIRANSSAVEERTRDGKRYLIVTDAAEWRAAAGRLLALVQRLKSTGDYDGTRELFDRHGTRFDPGLRDEVLARYADLSVPAYTGFVMPRLQPRTDATGEITDVVVTYPLSLEQQMLEWSGRREPPPLAED